MGDSEEEEYDEFEQQLRLEKEEKERRSRCSKIKHGTIRTDPDGTEYEWDADKLAYFPKIDENFIAQYQMNYGEKPEPEKAADTEKPSTESTTDWSTYFSYVLKYTTEHGKYPPEMIPSHIEYYRKLYQYYYPSSDTSKGAKPKGAKPKGSQDENTEKAESKSASEEKKEGQDAEVKGDAEGKDVEGKNPQNDKEDTDDDKEADKNAESAQEETAEEKAYREYYEYYQKHYQTQGEPGEDSEQQEFDEWAYYNYYYGNTEEGEQLEGKEEEKEQTVKEDEEGEKGDKKDLKRKPNEQGWFDIEHTKNTNVYVSGLPDDVTDDEFKELMSKCGMITYDPRNNSPKLKLYRDAEGKPKGDGLCCYIKSESVGLALQMLDEYDVRGHRISVEVAKFELKGKFDPKKRKKLSGREKKRIKEQQEKMFDWRPDKPKGYRPKHERIIVIRNAFDPLEFEKDPKKIQILREELRAQCVNFGTVKKVIVYDRHTEGLVTVAFTEVAEADLARESLHGRYFQRRQINVEPWDGKMKYDVQETEEEKKARLNMWGEFLEKGEEGAGKSKGGEKAVNKGVGGAVSRTGAAAGGVTGGEGKETTAEDLEEGKGPKGDVGMDVGEGEGKEDVGKTKEAGGATGGEGKDTTARDPEEETGPEGDVAEAEGVTGGEGKESIAGDPEEGKGPKGDVAMDVGEGEGKEDVCKTKETPPQEPISIDSEPVATKATEQDGKEESAKEQLKEGEQDPIAQDTETNMDS